MQNKITVVPATVDVNRRYSDNKEQAVSMLSGIANLTGKLIDEVCSDFITAKEGYEYIEINTDGAYNIDRCKNMHTVYKKYEIIVIELSNQQKLNKQLKVPLSEKCTSTLSPESKLNALSDKAVRVLPKDPIKAVEVLEKLPDTTTVKVVARVVAEVMEIHTPIPEVIDTVVTPNPLELEIKELKAQLKVEKSKSKELRKELKSRVDLTELTTASELLEKFFQRLIHAQENYTAKLKHKQKRSLVINSVGNANLYECLGLGIGCSLDELKVAYKKLAKLYHPDKGGDTNKFAKINNAYTALKEQLKETR